MSYAYFRYITFDKEKFFTMVLMPEKDGCYPTVITRSPYVKAAENKSEEELLTEFEKANSLWTENGYAIVFQHCRGQGKSTGEFIPYVHEREDGLFLQDWIRKQSFYNGELYLMGASYTASLHYSTHPFESDIKGAVFMVQDSERYRLWYRNGQMRRGHANWHFNLYKDKCGLNKTHNMDSFSELPLENLSEKVLSDRAEDFEEMLKAENENSPFWKTRNGGAEARDAVRFANIPILLTTGYNDFYVGGVFSMWNEMDDATKAKSALIVSPYNHGDGFDKASGIEFQTGSIKEKFGNSYALEWFQSIRNKVPSFVPKGEITYYRAFENKWDSDFYLTETKDLIVPLGEGEKTIKYDPENPPSFNPEGIYQKEPFAREDIVTLYTEPFDRDLFVKGKMGMRLNVSSNCEDTTFYSMISLETENGDYGLRHDISSLCKALGNYDKGEKVTLDFSFDEYAFLIKKGQRLRIDIAPTDKNTYVCHTNIKGDYYKKDACKKAENKVYLGASHIKLPVEVREND